MCEKLEVMYTPVLHKFNNGNNRKTKIEFKFAQYAMHLCKYIHMYCYKQP